MRTILFVFVIVFFSAINVKGQDAKADHPTYKSAIGLRFYPLGVSFKSNLEYRKRSIEIIAYFKDGFSVAGLYEWNFILNEQKNLKAYIGGGGHIGYLKESAGGGAVVGVNGVVGLDYKFLRLPINLTLDWQPSLEFGKNNDFKGWGGIGARYTF